MPYVTRASVLAKIPEPMLRDALDDDGDGLEDDGLLDTIIEDASQEADALVASRYTVPFTTTVPAVIAAAAGAFVLEAIYRRRRVPEDDNPFAKEAESWREVLRAVGAGKRQLDAAQAVAIAAESGGNPYVPGRVPVMDSPATYEPET